MYLPGNRRKFNTGIYIYIYMKAEVILYTFASINDNQKEYWTLCLEELGQI